MESIIEDLNKIVSKLEYGDISKNDVVRLLEMAMSEMQDLDSE